MSEGVAFDTSDLLPGPYVSGHALAEWFVRNWWRLSFEPYLVTGANDSLDKWERAHWLSSIGEGYVWPNICIASDGYRVSLTSSAYEDLYAKSFRYLGPTRAETVPLQVFHHAVDKFISCVVERMTRTRPKMRWQLPTQWSTLEEARAEPLTMQRRRFEAMLGFNPGEADDTELDRGIEASKKVGSDAIMELAAESNGQGERQRFDPMALAEIAKSKGFTRDVNDHVSFSPSAEVPKWGEVAAWRVGVATARALRNQENLNGQSISDRKLAQMAATRTNVIQNTGRRSPEISFSLERDPKSSWIALRSKWAEGRRFDLARLIGDRLFANGINEPMQPATQSFTYRQKVQRAFAAELLAPIDAISEYLGADRSDENVHRAADHFKVSSLTIHSSLQNKYRI